MKKLKLNDEKIGELHIKYHIPQEYFYFNLGEAYRENKQYDQSIYYFKKATDCQEKIKI